MERWKYEGISRTRYHTARMKNVILYVKGPEKSPKVLKVDPPPRADEHP